MYDHTTFKTTVSVLLTVYKEVMIFVAIKTMLYYIQSDMKVSWEVRYFFITTKSYI